MTKLGNVQNLKQIGESLRFFCHSCGQKLDAAGFEPFTVTGCPNCDAKIIVPKWFGNYLLEEPVGRGGMATVYRAIELTLDREVAIKILDTDIINDPQNTNLFLHEARTAATVNHRAVIPIYTCGIEEGRTFIAMQFMNGGSIESVQEKSTSFLPIKDVLQWIRDAAEGLRNALSHGIIHHDIKPGNIMLDAENNARIGDFGISNSASSNTLNDEMRSTINSFVTPNYVSPERVMGLDEDERGDIYSLGATFYHLLTHQTPFQHTDIYEVARMRLSVIPTQPNELRPEIPHPVNNLVMGMLAIDPNARPTYTQIIDELNHVLANIQKGKPSVHRKFMTKGNSARGSISTKIPVANTGYGRLIIITLALMCAFAIASYFMTKTVFGAEELTHLLPPAISIQTDFDKLPNAICPIPVTTEHIKTRLSRANRRPIFSKTYDTKDSVFKKFGTAYLEKLPADEKPKESYMVRQLPLLLPELIKTMQAMPYDQSPIEVKPPSGLGSKKHMNIINFQGATIAYDKYLAIPKTPSRLIRKQWNELKTTEVIKIMKYYANLKEEAGQPKDAAEAFYKLAIFQDWVADYKGAAESLNQAVKLNHELLPLINKVFGK